MNTVTLISEIAAVVAAGQDERIRDHFTALELSVLEEDRLSDAHVAALEALLRDMAFVQLTESWQVVRLLDNNWELLSNDHRTRLRAVLLDTFDRFGNWMGAFVIAEILGGKYADEQALVDLERLAETAQMPARQLVPHGLETLARTTDDQGLRGRAVSRLRILLADPVEEVRTEASEALARVDHPLRG